MLLLASALLPGSPGLGDGPEFTLSLALGAIPHPTGYPIYVLLGHAFASLAHLAGLPWAAAANAWSAVGAAVAIALHARLGFEIARDRGSRALRSPAIRLAAVAPAALLALNPVWLMSATQAEVYSWSYALTAAAVLFSYRTVREFERAGAGPGVAPEPHLVRRAAAWGLLCGLSITQHALSVVILLPLSIVMLVAARRCRGSRVAALLAGAGSALGVFVAANAFVAYRAFHPPEYQWPIDPSWIGVWRHVCGSLYASYFGGFAPRGIQVDLIRTGILPYFPLLPLVGVWALRTTRSPLRRWLLAMFVATTALSVFVFSYRVTDPAAYFVPVVMLTSLLAVPLVSWLAERRSVAFAAAALAAAIAIVGIPSIRGSLWLREGLDGVDANIRAGWAAVPFDRGIVIWLDDYAARLELLRITEHRRPELVVVNPNLLTWPANRIRFYRKFGFDPVGGVKSDYVAELPARLHEKTGLPVVDFRDVLESRVPR